jgi:hypothetical protein
MPRNISGGGKATKAVSVVLGLPELKAKVKKLTGALVADEAQKIVGSAAWYASTEVRSAAQGVGVPHEVFANIFSYSKPQTTRSGGAAKVSALTGIRKKGRARPFAVSYAEWNNKNAYSRLRGKGRGKARVFKSGGVVAAGAKVGENLATMWELGTTKQAAKPFFRPAIMRAQTRVMTMLAAGYKALIDKYAAATP